MTTHQAMPGPSEPHFIDKPDLIAAALLWTAVERLLIAPPYPLPESGAGPKMLHVLAKLGLVELQVNGKAVLTAKGAKLLLDSAA